MFKAPKAIANHPGVLEVLDGPDEGIMEYKYNVFLKEGWHFSNDVVRMYGCREGNFNTVAEFRQAKPEQK